MIFLGHEILLIFPDFPKVEGTLLIVGPCDNLFQSYSHDLTLYLQKKSYLICRYEIFITAWGKVIFSQTSVILSRGGADTPPGQRIPLYGKERAVRILLECILVLVERLLSSRPAAGRVLITDTLIQERFVSIILSVMFRQQQAV